MGMLKGAHQPVVLVLTAAVAVLVLAAAGAAQSEFTAAATLQIAIHETGSENHPNSHSIGGVKFTVESLSAGVHLANIGSGAALIFPNKGVPKVVDGEQQAPVTGSERLTSKNGELLFLSGAVSRGPRPTGPLAHGHLLSACSRALCSGPRQRPTAAEC